MVFIRTLLVHGTLSIMLVKRKVGMNNYKCFQMFLETFGTLTSTNLGRRENIIYKSCMRGIIIHENSLR